MSVVEYKRGEGKFTALVEANNLLVYTLQICSNEKNFDPRFQKVMMDDIIKTTKDIYVIAYTANEINVKSREQAVKRLSMLEDSELCCSRMLALLQTAKKIYHVDSYRIKHWGQRLTEVKGLIHSWYLSERKRYEEYLE